MPKEIVSQEEIPLPQVKKILSKRSKEGDLSFQQSITLEHAAAFSKMAPAVAAKLVTRLMTKFELNRGIAVQIVNIAPTTEEELKVILGSQASKFTDEKIIEIIDMVMKARS
ncbi:MAG: RNA polymerase Rpb4 family protein [Candidatus Thorarchaeota archaeon]